jgi:hypothetical protein
MEIMHVNDIRFKRPDRFPRLPVCRKIKRERKKLQHSEFFVGKYEGLNRMSLSRHFFHFILKDGVLAAFQRIKRMNEKYPHV